ncbi:hypothetical protein [Nocardioides sp. SR21]|uniref:hypothetical protein n=1 Tax=Nocardioides sp. SR21 TaxID=2919501 RepID=UPI001FAA828A|nr:hypothetical protein [Nocardioides sp. SR21]
MSTEVIVYVLTALAAVVVVLTQVRLARSEGGAGRHDVGRGLVHAHTVTGVIALVLWVAFLAAPDDSALGGDAIGIAAIAFWWIVVVLGLLILARWLPSRGKHSSGGHEDTWSDGPGLSILAHVGMLVGVGVFTWAYLTAHV